MEIQLVRDSTAIWASDTMGAAFAVATTQNASGVMTVDYIDSPATTSATTYKFQFKRTTAFTSTARVQSNNKTSIMILDEVL